MSNENITTDSNQVKTNQTVLSPLGGLVIAVIASIAGYFSVMLFHDIIRGSASWLRIALLLLVFWVLVFFLIAFIASAAKGRLIHSCSTTLDPWSWAGYGVFVTMIALGCGTIGAWMNFGLTMWDSTLTLAETPVVSLLLIGVAGHVGYFYTTDTSDDETSETKKESGNSEKGDNKKASDPKQNNEISKKTQGPSNTQQQTQSNSHETAGMSDLNFDWQRETDVSMSDVGGMEEIKCQLKQEIVRPLTTDRDKAAALDISIPNLLLYGPPGTGKTFIAKALATELGLPFVSLSGADVTSKWINESPQKINCLFAEAKTLSKEEGGAVIFLDEIDAVLPDRTNSSHEETQKVVNEFLAHLQDTDKHNIVFIGATNRRGELDEAAIRNGRIDREIEVTYPDLKGRIGILQAQLQTRENRLSKEQLLDLAERTDGYSAADLQALVEDAARHAAFERQVNYITVIDFREVL